MIDFVCLNVSCKPKMLIRSREATRCNSKEETFKDENDDKLSYDLGRGGADEESILHLTRP